MGNIYNMRYWTRTTHNFNNETREWEFKKELPLYEPKGLKGLGVHCLESGAWKTDFEVFNSYDKAYRDNVDFGQRPTNNEIVEELKYLESLNMIKSK